MGERHTVIVGGGLIGVSTAYYLARAGSRVTVLERERVGGAASSGNAGSIAPDHGPINRPLPLTRVLRWLLDERGPIYVPLRPDAELVRWLWDFRRASTHRRVEESLAALSPLGRRSQELFDELIASERLQCGYRRLGFYEVFRTERAFAAGSAEAERTERRGFGVEILEGDAMREREPALTQEVVGAVWHREGATCDPHEFVLALAEAARRHGASFREGVSVESLVRGASRVGGVRTVSGEELAGDEVVLATGAYSRGLLAPFGMRFPLLPAKGYHRDLSPERGHAPPLRVPCQLAESLIFCTPLADRVRFAGTLEFSGVDHSVRQARLEQLTRGARPYLGALNAEEPLSEWCGLRPCLPDGLPAVGLVEGVGGLWVATGHAMMGLTLGPVTGELLAASILEGRPAPLLRPLDPGRFGRARPAS